MEQPDHAAIIARIEHVGEKIDTFRRETQATHEKMWDRMNKSATAFSAMAEANKAVVAQAGDHEQRIRVNEGFRILAGSSQASERGLIARMRDWLAVLVAIGAFVVAWFKGGG